MKRLRNYLAAVFLMAAGAAISQTTLFSGAQVPSQFNVMTYGAKCDGTTDDSLAFNATVTAAKAAMVTLGGLSLSASVAIVIPSGFTCYISSTVNMTAIYAYRGVQVWGGKILCQTNGTPCIDALGSRFIQWNSLVIQGTQTNPPSYGIQIGRITASGVGAACAEQNFTNITIDGYFTTAAFYNFACEVTNFTHSYFSNFYSTGTPHVLIQDGGNHFNITSAFVTQTLATDSGQSFNDNVFVNCSFQYLGSGTGDAIWIGGATRHGFVKSYGSVGAGGTNNAVVIWNFASGGIGNIMLDFDVHFESIPQYIFYIDGGVANPTIYGLRWNEHLNQVGTAVLARNTSNVTSPTISNFDFRVGKNLGGGSLNWFDDPTKFTLSGWVQYPNSGDFNGPPTFTGMKCLAAACAVAP